MYTFVVELTKDQAYITIIICLLQAKEKGDLLIVGVHSDGRSAGLIIFGCDYDCMVVAFKAYHH